MLSNDSFSSLNREFLIVCAVDFFNVYSAKFITFDQWIDVVVFFLYRLRYVASWSRTCHSQFFVYTFLCPRARHCLYPDWLCLAPPSMDKNSPCTRIHPSLSSPSPLHPPPPQCTGEGAGEGGWGREGGVNARALEMGVNDVSHIRFRFRLCTTSAVYPISRVYTILKNSKSWVTDKWSEKLSYFARKAELF